MKRIALLAVSLTTLFVATGCKVVVTGQSTYEVCDFSSDCYDSFDSCVPVANGSFSDSHCSRSCIDDLDCPGTGHCVNFGGDRTCFQSCITDAICEPGWSCHDLSDGSSVCLPGESAGPTPIAPYDACASPGTVDNCSTETDGCAGIFLDGSSGNICTSSCFDSSDCPRDSRGVRGECVALDGENFLCLERCSSHGDCLTGFSCRPPDVGFDPLCLPGL